MWGSKSLSSLHWSRRQRSEIPKSIESTTGKRANGVIRRGIMQAIVSNCRIVEIIIGEDNSRIEGVKVTGTEYSRTTVTSARIIQIIIIIIIIIIIY